MHMSYTVVRTSRDLRNNYADIVRSLKQNNHIIITNKGVVEAVLIGIEEYREYEDFLHRRFIYNELQKSKALLNNKDIALTDAEDVFAGLRKKRDERRLWAAMETVEEKSD